MENKVKNFLINNINQTEKTETNRIKETKGNIQNANRYV